MSLLQISDPRAAPTPIGIDLGTTHSLVAYVAPTGEPIAIRVCDDDPLVPSVVHYRQDGGVVVGKDAQVFALACPQDTIVSAKRFMGRGADDPETKRLGSNVFATNQGSVVQFQVGPNRVVTPVEVSAEILKALRERAEQELGVLGGVVITVPAYFDEAQRQATKDAGKLAGLEVLRLLNEPTAAALAYGLDKQSNGTFVVYDLGGGTFDVTILTLEDGVFQVRSTGGDTQLGGDDMDRELARQFLSDLGFNENELSSELARAVLNAARAAKHALTHTQHVEIEMELPGELSPRRVSMEREEFEKQIQPLLQRTGTACKRALKDAALQKEDIDGVILVGGATRVPLVRRYVKELFGKEPLADVDPDQVVALGAALQAEMLAGQSSRDDVLLLDVLPLSLGIETMGGVVERILPRNTAIPAEAVQTFTTYADRQTGFELHVVQGERDMAEDCRSLARFVLKGIPPMAAGLARLEVRLRVDENGLLHVSAKEKTTGKEQEIEVKPSYGLSDQEIEKLLLDAYAHGQEDVQKRALREQQIEAQRLLDATEKAMRDDADLLNQDEREAIAQVMKQLKTASAGTQHDTIARLIEELDNVSKPFAGRRMDRSIGAALSGQSLKELENQTVHAQGIEAHLGRS